MTIWDSTIIGVECACGHIVQLNRNEQTKKFGSHIKIVDLNYFYEQFVCEKCGAKHPKTFDKNKNLLFDPKNLKKCTACKKYIPIPRQRNPEPENEYCSSECQHFGYITPEEQKKIEERQKIISKKIGEEEAEAEKQRIIELSMSNWDTQYLAGYNWKAGWSLDYYTIKSTPLPGGGFNTVYTELGGLINQIKYRGDKSKIKPLAKKISDFMKKKIMVTPYLSGIIPTLPSNTNRKFQLVFDIAEELAKEINIPILKDCLIKTKETPLMKEIADKEEKKKILRGIFSVINNNLIKNKRVLLFDDVFGSGETLKEITRVLYKEGLVKDVYVLTATIIRTTGLAQ